MVRNQSPVRLGVWGSVNSVSREPQETPGWQAICIRHQRESSCLLLATVTWHRFLLRLDISIGVMVGKMRGDHVEVWCVPSATNVPYKWRSQDMFREFECWYPNFLKLNYVCARDVNNHNYHSRADSIRTAVIDTIKIDKLSNFRSPKTTVEWIESFRGPCWTKQTTISSVQHAQENSALYLCYYFPHNNTF